MSKKYLYQYVAMFEWGYNVKRATSGYTSGSGGSTVTPQKHLTGDGAAGATAETLNTTQASGAQVTILRQEAWNVQQGFTYLPAPEHRLTFNPGEALIISSETPADVVSLNGTVVIEEVG